MFVFCFAVQNITYLSLNALVFGLTFTDEKVGILPRQLTSGSTAV